MSYSLTVQAEVYFRGLVGDRSGGEGAGKRRHDGDGAGGGRQGISAGNVVGRGSAEERRGGGGGLRLVSSEEMEGGIGDRGVGGRRRAGSAE